MSAWTASKVNTNTTKPEKMLGNFNKPVFEPEQWKNFYMKNPQFLSNACKIERIEEIDECEAERRLQEILLKATAVEKCLQLKGMQKVCDLFENLKEFAGEQESMFSSVTELDEFLSSMDLLFLKHPRSREFRNSGVGFRRFVQKLVEKMSLGEKIHKDDVEKLLDDHYRSIELEAESANVEKSYSTFQKHELLLDFESLRRLSRDVRGFHYDTKSELLTLTDSATTHLPLHLPILVKLVSNGSLDISRTVTGTCIVTKSFNRYLNGFVESGLLAGVGFNFKKGPFFKALGIHQDTAFVNESLSIKLWFKGAIHSNSCSPVEVFEANPQCQGVSELPIAPKLIGSKLRMKTGTQVDADFGGVTDWLTAEQKNLFKIDPKGLFTGSNIEKATSTSGAN